MDERCRTPRFVRMTGTSVVVAVDFQKRLILADWGRGVSGHGGKQHAEKG
jgi:hypothetical protein